MYLLLGVIKVLEFVIVTLIWAVLTGFDWIANNQRLAHKCLLIVEELMKDD